MSFRVAARTILHLGAELISSDGIALYELIKNAYDARSPSVRIDVVSRIGRRAQREVLAAAEYPGSITATRLRALRALCTEELVVGAPDRSSLESRLAECRKLEDLVETVQEANTLTVADRGIGMTFAHLDEAFLTIGTRSKQRMKHADAVDGRPVVLGEKGIGRLSAMRLGSRLQVRTAAAGDTRWNVLDIDWDDFGHDSDDFLEDVAVSPAIDGPLGSEDKPGTTIRVSGLHRQWSRKHVDEIARNDFARLNDPFERQPRLPILITHNGEPVTIPRIESWVLAHAHARCEGSFRALGDETLIFSGTMQYRGRDDTFAYDQTSLLASSEASGLDILRGIGPFSVQLYWFNRSLLTALDNVGDLGEVRKRLALWTGGLMLYRDGFRVLPYGGPDDDWLALDRKALARSGFKLNRQQIVGRVLITGRGNPQLKDQSNREGLIDNEEKRALQNLLAHMVQQTMWSFLNRVERADRPPREPVREEVIDERLTREEDRLERNLALLIERVPAVSREREIVTGIRDGLAMLREAMNDVRQLAREYEDGRTQLLNLAGVGLTVEILAHELNRSAEAALGMLAHVSGRDLPASADKALQSLGAQLKTLQKRLRVLDPMSTSGRNRKEKVALPALLQDILESHTDQFAREQVSGSLKVLPDRSSRLVVTVVRGMIVQIIENLIANSVFWLRQTKRINPDFQPAIEIVLDTEDRQVRFTDNGPGIAADDAERVFEAFYTRKPAGGGKGLGLFISREIAIYHGAKLNLEAGLDGVLRTFVLDLGDMK